MATQFPRLALADSGADLFGRRVPDRVARFLGSFFTASPRSAAHLEAAKAQLKPLETEVQNLRVYQQRRVELQSEMEALQKQLATLQTIVPEDKQVDQFIIMLQTAAS